MPIRKQEICRCPIAVQFTTGCDKGHTFGQRLVLERISGTVKSRKENLNRSQLARIRLEPVTVQLRLKKRAVAALVQAAIQNQTSIETEAQAVLDNLRPE